MVMKKLVSFVLALFMLLGTSVSANTINAEFYNSDLRINAVSDSYIVLSGYDADKKLILSKLINKTDDGFVLQNADNSLNYKVYIPTKSTFSDVDILPQSTITPTPTPQSTYPKIYERASDAVHTIAIVKEISAVHNNGDTEYAVDTYIRGGEERFIIPRDVTIAVAAEHFSYMEGKNASDLSEGDVIYLEISASGEVKNIALVTRPADDNPVTSDIDYGTNFEKLFATSGNFVYGAPKVGTVMQYGIHSSDKYQFAFGPVIKKHSKTLVLYNKTGLMDKAIEITYTPDTIVYLCDVKASNRVSLGTTADILKSQIPNVAFDEDNNIKAYLDEYEYNYAFVRVVNDIATEIVIFGTYSE